MVQPEILRLKVYEAVLVVGEDAFAPIDIRVRVKGGGHVSQVYAIRQAIAKAVVAYYAKYFDAASAFELKKKLVSYDKSLLIADPRRMEPKKFGGQGARARRQKRYIKSLLLSILSSWVSDLLFTVTVKCSVDVCIFYYSLLYGIRTLSHSCFQHAPQMCTQVLVNSEKQL